MHLFKSQVQQMRDWRIKHGQSVSQKTVRNMSTKDCQSLFKQSTSQPIDFCAIGQSNEGSATGKENFFFWGGGGRGGGKGRSD